MPRLSFFCPGPPEKPGDEPGSAAFSGLAESRLEQRSVVRIKQRFGPLVVDAELCVGIDAYARARETSRIAPRLSLDPAATVFQLGTILASVAPSAGRG